MVKMPLSVLLAICHQLNSFIPSQVAAARLWVDLDPGFVAMLVDVAEYVPDEDIREWAIRELQYDEHIDTEPEE